MNAPSTPRATRAITRLAIRNTRRHPWRSLLIVILLALPLSGAIVVAAGQRAVFASPEEQTAWYYGQAEAVVHTTRGGLSDVPGEVDIEAVAASLGITPREAQLLVDWERTSDAGQTSDLLERALPDAQVSVVERTSVELGRRYLDVIGTNASDPITEGMLLLDEGSWPGNAGEISLTAAAADLQNVAIGDTVSIDPMGVFEVTGIHRVRADATALGAVVPPGTVALPMTTVHLVAGVPSGVDPYAAFARSIEDELGDEVAQVLFQTGTIQIAPADSFYGFDGGGAPLELDRPPVLAGFVAAVLLLEVGLIAAAAHSAGARRRLREFGLLGTIGAEPSHIRRLVVAEALGLGACSVVLGVIGGLLAVRALEGVIAGLPAHVVADVSSGWGDVVVPAVVALIASVLTAWWPARACARVPVLTALAGRMPGRALRFRSVPWSIGLVGVGLAFVGAGAASVRIDANLSDQALVVMLGGCLLVLAGAAIAGTWLVGVMAASANRLPLTLRIVARDAGRQQFRSAVAVAGLVVVLAAPVAIAAAAVTEEAHSRASFVPTTLTDEILVSRNVGPGETAGPIAERTLAAIGGIVDTTVLGSYQRLGDITTDSFGNSSVQSAWILPEAPDGADGLETVFATSQAALGSTSAIAALRLPPEAADILAEGRAIAVGEGAVPGPIVLTYAGGGSSVTLDAVRVGDRPATWIGPAYLLPPALADDLGLITIDETTVLASGDDLTADQRRALRELNLAPSTALGNDFIEVGDPFDSFARRVQAIALPVAAAVALLIGGCLMAIAATESDRDIGTMLRVGATPRLRRRFLGIQGWYHGALAAALAVPVGLLLLVALRRAYAEPPPLIVPWTSVGVVLLVVPILIGSGVAVGARSRTTAGARTDW